MRQTTWTPWAPDAMAEATELEGLVGLAALKVPERRLLESLPYHSAFDDHRAHVTACTDCLYDGRADCPEGEALLAVALVGIGEQQRMAAQN